MHLLRQSHLLGRLNLLVLLVRLTDQLDQLDQLLQLQKRLLGQLHPPHQLALRIHGDQLVPLVQENQLGR